MTKIHLKYELRFTKILSIKTQSAIIENLYEPFKVRGERQEILKDQPRYIYPQFRDGHIIRMAEDDQGFFVIFQPKAEEYEKIKAFAKIETKSKLLAKIRSLQYELRTVGKTEEELTSIEYKIDDLFNQVLEKPVTTKNSAPSIFISESDNSFRLFKAYAEKYVIDCYIDFSFIYQQMKKDKLLHPITHLNFMDWLLQENFITNEQYNCLKIKGQFYSLNKSTNSHRLNTYHNLKESIFSNNS